MTNTRNWIILAMLLAALAACDDEAKSTGLHPGPCVQENDDDADGMVDLRIVYTYDDAGLLVLRETDAEPDELDGVPEGASHYYYEGGLLVRKEVDYGANGSIEQYYYFIYNADDLVSTVEIMGDQEDELDGLYEFSYDESGNLLEAVYSFFMTEETVRDIERFTYDVYDNLVAEEHVFDAQLGDEVDEYHYHLLDGDGLRFRTDRDLDGDGEIDAETFYTYDAEDLLVLEETDTGPDQVIDKVETYEYDGGGNLTRYTRDEGADGFEDAIERFIYDCW